MGEQDAFAAAMSSSWQWVDGSRTEESAGEGWAAEGNPMYKWAQYDKPPVPVGGHQLGPGNTVLDATLFEEEERTPMEYSNRIMVFNLPVIGRIQYVKHPQGIISSSIVLAYWIYGSWSLFALVLFPHYSQDHISILPLLWYGTVSVLCIFSFARAVTQNPGRVPIGAKKERPIPKDQLENPEDSQYCVRCVQRRPQLAHHCSTCGQCVRRMDHHCPWINNCVGEDNRFLFTQLVLYALLMSSSALVFLFLDGYVWPKLMVPKHELDLFVVAYRYDLKIVCYVLSSMMMTLGGGLFCTQACMMRFDMTTLDMYKIQNTMLMQKMNPYVHGVPWPDQKRSCRTAYNDYCGTKYFMCYFNPCRRRIAQMITKPTHMV